LYREESPVTTGYEAVGTEAGQKVMALPGIEPRFSSPQAITLLAELLWFTKTDAER
jgi:hypothetical protein